MYNSCLITILALAFSSAIKAQLPSDSILLRAQVREVLTRYHDHGQSAAAAQKIELIWKIHQSNWQERPSMLAIDILALAGDIQHALTNYTLEIDYLWQANKLAKKLIPLEHPQFIAIRSALAEAYYQSEQSFVAKKIVDTTLTWADKAAPGLELADLYDKAAIFYELSGDIEVANSFQQKTKNIYARYAILPPKEQHKPIFRAFYQSMTQSRFKEAIPIGLDAYNCLNKNFPEGRGTSKFNILLALSWAALQYGDIDLSLSYCEKAEEQLKKSGLTNTYFMSDLEVRKALIFNQKKKFNEAIQWYTEALSKLEGTNFRARKGTILQSMANTLSNQGNLLEAKKAIEKSLGLYQEAKQYNIGLESDFLDVLNTQIMIIYSLEQYDEAIQRNLALISFIRTNYGAQHLSLPQAYNTLGLTYQHLKRYNEASTTYGLGLNAIGLTTAVPKLFDEIRYVDAGIALLWNRAENFRLWYNASKDTTCLRKSIADFELYVDFLDYLRTSYRTEGSKIGLSAENRVVYEHLILNYALMYESSKNIGWLNKAFIYAEKSKGLSLMENYRKSNTIEFSKLPTSLRQQEKALIDTLRVLEQKLATLQLLRVTNSSMLSALKNQIFAFQNEFSDFQLRLKKDFPDYFDLKYNASTLNLEHLKATINQDTLSVLSYFVGDNLVFAFMLTADTITIDFIQRTPVFVPIVNNFIARLTSVAQITSPTFARFDSLSNDLFELLIGPLKPHLSKKILVLPDGVIAYVPFEALISGLPSLPDKILSYPFLVKEYQFNYAYSASTWLELRKKNNTPLMGKSWLGVAPDYTRSSKTNPMQDDRSSPLRYAAEEITNIQKITNGNVLKNSVVTPDLFLKEMMRYKIVHFAGHAKANDDAGDLAYLTLNYPEYPAGSNKNQLFVQELYRTKIDADLVVLSACATGIGQLQKGEGLISLSRAFAYAGAKAVITSLWNVDDESTQKLFIEFYKALDVGMSKANALHRAKKNLFEGGGKFCHPYYWTGFIGIGDLR